MQATRAGTSGFVQPAAGSINPNTAARPSQPPAVSKLSKAHAERLDPPVSTPNPRPSRTEVHKPSEAGPKGGQASREPWMVPAPLPRGWNLRNLSGVVSKNLCNIRRLRVPLQSPTCDLLHLQRIERCVRQRYSGNKIDLRG